MKSVINSPSKEAAVQECVRFLAYFPFRYAAIVKMHGQWGWVSGKTMARLNSVARAGYEVYRITKS